jgi:hypothetical protein
MTTLTQRHRVRNFGNTAIGVPPSMMSIPARAKTFTTSLASSLSTQVKMPFLFIVE